jgi:hypothetical protein
MALSFFTNKNGQWYGGRHTKGCLMNKRLTISMDHTKEENTYTLTFPYGAPYGELYAAVCEMGAEIVRMADEQTRRQKEESVAPVEAAPQTEQATS